MCEAAESESRLGGREGLNQLCDGRRAGVRGTGDEIDDFRLGVDSLQVTVDNQSLDPDYAGRTALAQISVLIAVARGLLLANMARLAAFAALSQCLSRVQRLLLK